MKKGLLVPDLVLEVSWEVCNKVGGIYTVLSTHAQSLQRLVAEALVFAPQPQRISRHNAAAKSFFSFILFSP